MAIFGLAGVVIGGILTGIVQVMLDKRREINAIAVSKRLVLDELHNVWTHLDLLTTAGVTPRALAFDALANFLPTTDWMTHRDTLASPRALNDSEWIALSNLMHSAASLRRLLGELPPLSPIPTGLDVVGLRDLAAGVFEHYRGVAPRDLGDLQ